MAVTYEPIASLTLGSAASTFSFTSIPATYTDLVLVVASRTTAPSASGLRARINSDTGTNYSVTGIDGNGSSATSGRLSNMNYLFITNSEANSPTGLGITAFMSYSQTNTFKTVLNTFANTAAGLTVGRQAALWRSTSAITSLTIYENNVSYQIAAGSTFSLYGIKAA